MYPHLPPPTPPSFPLDFYCIGNFDSWNLGVNVMCFHCCFGPPCSTKDNLLIIQAFKYVNFSKRQPFPRDNWNSNQMMMYLLTPSGKERAARQINWHIYGFGSSSLLAWAWTEPTEPEPMVWFQVQQISWTKPKVQFSVFKKFARTWPTWTAASLFTTHMPVCLSGDLPTFLNHSTRAHGYSSPSYVKEKNNLTWTTLIPRNPFLSSSSTTNTQSCHGPELRHDGVDWICSRRMPRKPEGSLGA